MSRILCDTPRLRPWFRRTRVEKRAANTHREREGDRQTDTHTHTPDWTQHSQCAPSVHHQRLLLRPDSACSRRPAPIIVSHHTTPSTNTLHTTHYTLHTTHNIQHTTYNAQRKAHSTLRTAHNTQTQHTPRTHTNTTCTTQHTQTTCTQRAHTHLF